MDVTGIESSTPTITVDYLIDDILATHNIEMFHSRCW
jgi:hypothetical protein